MEYISRDTKVQTTGQLTPEIIASKLFSMHTKAHFYHLQTDKFSLHKMLNDLYEALEDSKDAICEYLLGIQAPKRFAGLTNESIPGYSDQVLIDFLNDGFAFSVKLCEYAESRNLEQLCNLSSELQNAFVKSKYLATLK